MDLQLRHLRALVAVADHASFTEAAAVLGISQAAVSRSVAGLEELLGLGLVERTTRSVTLTDIGDRMVPLARQVLGAIEQMHRLAAAADAGLQVGFAWSTLGRHTRTVQREWGRRHPGVPLVFLQSNTATAGLTEGVANVAVLRRAVTDDRFETVDVGIELRYAAVATDHPLARRRTVRLADLSRYVVGVDDRTGTTTMDLWPDAPPARTRSTRGVDEWLTFIAAGDGVGVTSEATAHQYPRPGVAYRQVRDAPPITVRLAWWRRNPPARLADLIELTRQAFRPGGG